MGRAVRPEKSKANGIRISSILFLMLRFAVIVPFCLYIWWTVMPYYAEVMGPLSATAFRWVLRMPVEGYSVDTGGLMNTRTVLSFRLEDGSNPGIQMGHLFSNIAPYVALVLATTGITLKRRLFILAIGPAILFIGHLLFLIAAFALMERIEGATQIPTALGQLLITMPFLLWVVLAYWEKLLGLLTAGTAASSSEKAEESVT